MPVSSGSVAFSRHISIRGDGGLASIAPAMSYKQRNQDKAQDCTVPHVGINVKC